jgi:hypothetical protein
MEARSPIFGRSNNALALNPTQNGKTADINITVAGSDFYVSTPESDVGYSETTSLKVSFVSPTPC